jgi:hypothetical protein
VNKDVKQLVRSIEHIEGVEVRNTGSGHLAIYRQGQFLVTLASTPGDRRWRENAMATLRQAGITPANGPLGPPKRPVDIMTVAQLRQRVKELSNRSAFARFLIEDMPRLQPALRTYKTHDSASASLNDLVHKTNGGLSSWTHLLLDTAMREWDARPVIVESGNGVTITEAKEISEAELGAVAEKEEKEQTEPVTEPPVNRLATVGMVELARDHDDLTGRINEMAERLKTLTAQLDELVSRRQAVSDEILTRLDKAEGRP